MSYFDNTTLQSMGFKHIGKNVLISVKASIYNPERISIGDNARVDDFCVLSGNISIGRNVHIAAQCLIAGGQPGILLDDYSGLAYGVKVFAQSDDYSGKAMTNPTIPTAYKQEFFASVKIGRHVIIGANSTILPGVVIAEGCAIGAQTLMRKSTESWTIYCGNPAKRLKTRSQELLKLEAAFLNN